MPGVEVAACFIREGLWFPPGSLKVCVDGTTHASPARLKLVIGLTGGIGAGKSRVASVLEELGAAVVDSDAMTREELSKPEVVETFRGWWGDRVCKADGGIDRAAMGEIIFGDETQRRRMEAYLYPRLERRRHRMMRAFNADPSVRAIVFNSPLLYEVGLDKVCDVVLFVECDRRTRVERVARTRGWTERELDRREKLQKPLDMKRRTADHTVVNDTDVDALRSQIKPLYERLLTNHSSC